MNRKRQNNKIEQKKNIIENILDCFSKSAMFLFIFLTLIIVITSLLFIFNIKIFSAELIIIYLISAIGFLVFNKKEFNKTITSIVIGTLVFIFSVIISGHIFDNTPDGNTYHKLAVGAMKNGWNPVWQDIEEFNKTKKNPFNILDDNVNIKWVNTYGKATEIYGAVVYKFTDNIETGKSYNMLFVFIGLFIIYEIMKQLKFSTIKSIILGAVIALNPISLTQLTNYYLDGVLTICLLIIILITMNRELLDKKSNYLILALSVIWSCSVKFNGFAYAAVFCGIYYLYNNFYRLKKDNKNFKSKLITETVFYAVVVFISVVIVGGSSYTKNFIKYGHPLYPLYGKGHVENMVLKEMPKSMHNDNNLEIFIKGIYSKTENSSPSYSDIGNEPDWKIPFTISKEELLNMCIPDIRIGGFGYFFGGVFLLTIIGTIIYLIKYLKEKNYDFIARNLIFIGLSIILVLALDGSYWARYIPYVYMIPVLCIMNLFKLYSNKKLATIYAYIICAFLLLDSVLVLGVQVYSTKQNNAYHQLNLDNFASYAKTQDIVDIRLNHHGIQGVQYNLDDINIKNYQLVEYEKETQGYGFTY